ncbi:MAG: hypothetical protein L3J00_00330 [Thiomicrorhabdus sp.]|nr:hypothetical protein [Thiomicrorhabdus sp.]
MNDVKLNEMRELNFNEIEEVSGGLDWRDTFGIAGAAVGTVLGRGNAWATAGGTAAGLSLYDYGNTLYRSWALNDYNRNPYGW